MCVRVCMCEYVRVYVRACAYACPRSVFQPCLITSCTTHEIVF